ncbi:hypothetical protein QUF63_03540 [Anaerolineales bacterium HSG25]|nr:hypothetical protein [Anaerolineales bacterium HSG25]
MIPQSLKTDVIHLFMVQPEIERVIFSGLWLDAVAFWAGDMKTVIQVLQKGMASSEYSAFVEQLQRQSRV